MKQINISQVSAIFANGSYPIELLLYFPYRINTTRLRRALKKVSGPFWPAFGTYDDGRITAKPYLEDECFDERSMDSLFDPNTGRETMHTNYGAMVPVSTPRLFFLKVLHFTNGTMLIPKMNHLAGDGYSYFFLLSVLAALTRLGGVPLAPSIITTFFRPQCDRTLDASFRFSVSPPKAEAPDLKTAVEFLEVEQAEIRDQAKRAFESSGLRVSTNDILSAKVIKIILDEREGKQPENFRLVIPVDVRRGVPELGPRFFGTGIILHNVPFQPEVVHQSSIEELATTIRKSFPAVNSNSFHAFLKKVEGWIEAGQLDLLRPYDPENECLVTNLSRMPVTRLDFGSGPPSMVVPLTLGRSSAGVYTQDDKFVLRLIR